MVENANYAVDMPTQEGKTVLRVKRTAIKQRFNADDRRGSTVSLCVLQKIIANRKGHVKNCHVIV